MANILISDLLMSVVIWLSDRIMGIALRWEKASFCFSPQLNGQLVFIAARPSNFKDRFGYDVKFNETFLVLGYTRF